MKRLQEISLWIGIVAFTLSVFALGFALARFFFSYESEGAKNTCLQYEQAGVIQKGSCTCVEKLYKNWSESYDWKDACYILNTRNKISYE